MKNDKHFLNIFKRIFFCTLCLSFILGISSQKVKGTVSYVSILSNPCVNSFSGTEPEPTETTQPTTTTEPTQTTSPIPSSSATQPSETSESTTAVVPSESIQPTTVQPTTDATEFTTIPATVPAPFTNPTGATQPLTNDNGSNSNVPPKTGGASLDWYMLCILFSVTGLAICWKLGKKPES